MSATPSRIELTCEFIPSILSGPIGFVTFVCCRHLFGIGFLLRIGFVRRVGSGHYETRPNGSSSRCAVRSTRTITSPAGRGGGCCGREGAGRAARAEGGGTARGRVGLPCQ